jgi:Protein of unknown function (DUF1214)
VKPILQYLQEADATADRLGYVDPALRAAYRAHVLMILSAAYVEVFGTNMESPDWVPYIPYYLPRLAPNPDTIYHFAPLDPLGSYRFAGVRGTETIAAMTLRKGGAHLGERCGPRVAEIDLNSIETDVSGRFEFRLSAERPADYAGSWFALPAQARCVTLRRVTQESSQIDGTCGIERLDRLAARAALADAEISQRMNHVASYAGLQNEFLLSYMNRLRQAGAERGFVLEDQSAFGGLVVQSHYFYLFSLEPDEVIVLETELPQRCKYWSVQALNPFATTIDYVLHQSSLNDRQAKVDTDGRVRMVLAVADPGVPNWLDTAGWRQGAVQWRWNESDSAPQPVATKLKLHDLDRFLPRQTPRVGAEARRAQLSARAAHYQARRR